MWMISPFKGELGCYPHNMALFIAELVILFFFLLLGMKFWTKNKTIRDQLRQILQDNVPESQEYVPENQEYVPENQEYVPENQEYVPENQEYVPENQE